MLDARDVLAAAERFPWAGRARARMPEREVVGLSEDTAQALAVWIDRRSRLTARLEGGVPRHLWLSAPPSPDAGVPISNCGISKWYKKVADAVQIEQDAAGTPEADLVPTRWETMRRTLLAQQEACQGTS
ncbi:hypothetical protein ABZY45_19880 [Streptomyces sp. NPDC006516]|uniref:hypothetical protein n=1 Tax=Streptomyces sp. NPDC006516 TaxID=3154309 RepID=UPI0033B65528